MNVYAIRHIPTGAFLPSRKGRGFSNDEPIAEGGALGPRLFATKRGASCALTAWLQGVFEVHRSGYADEYDEERTVTPQPHRKREEMEIVAYELAELAK